MKRKAVLLGVGLSCAYLCLFLLIQSPITVNQGRGWDGVSYHAMVERDFSTVPTPFRFRILVPSLVRGLPFDDLLFRFKVVNLAVGLLAAILTWVFLLRFHGERLRLTTLALSWLLIVGTPVSPIPESAWYPAQTDALTNVFVWLTVCLALSPKRGASTYVQCSIVFLFGSLTRESFPMFLMMFFLRSDLTSRYRWQVSKENIDLGLRAISGAVGSALGLWIVFHLADMNPLASKSEEFVERLVSHSPTSVLAALVNVYGAALLFYIAWRTMTFGARKARLPGHPLGIGRANIAVIMAAIGVVALGGGTNTERLLYWGVPALVVYLGPHIDHIVRQRRGVASIVALLAAIMNRTFLPIEQSGIAQCSIGSIVDGTSTWLGHWVQICSASSQSNLVAAYSACCLGVIGISWVATLRAKHP